MRFTDASTPASAEPCHRCGDRGGGPTGLHARHRGVGVPVRRLPLLGAALARVGLLGAALTLAGCHALGPGSAGAAASTPPAGAPSTATTPPPSSVASTSAPAAPPAADARHPPVALPPPRASRHWAEFKLQAAQRMVAANPAITYTDKVPDVLLAIPVLEVELHADGSIRRIDVLRRPGQAPETTQMAVDAVRRAAPYGDVTRLPRPWKFSEAFLFNDERRFKPRTLDQ